MFKSYIVQAVAVIATTLWTGIGAGWVAGVVVLAAWSIAYFIARRWPTARWSRGLIATGMIVAVSVYNLTALSRKPTDEGDSDASTKNEEVVAPGTIVVEAGTGELLNGGTLSYIAESARGLEAYLGDDQATARYKVTASKSGQYKLRVKLSDDGLHYDGARSVTVKIGGQTYPYVHLSEDTKGWKYYDVATVNLAAGENTIDFIKNETTTAAYVMDEFQLVPQQ
jgi:hypothetical protein